MRSIPFLSDKRQLARQAISAWLIYFLSIILFATIATIFSIFIWKAEFAILASLLLTSFITIKLHLNLKKTGYSLTRFNKSNLSEVLEHTDGSFELISKLRSELARERDLNNEKIDSIIKNEFGGSRLIF